MSSDLNYLLLLCNATIAFLWVFSQYVYIPYPVHLLSLVGAILYTACHYSLTLAPDVHEQLSKQASKLSSTSSFSPLEPRETLRQEEAYQFPIVGSFALFMLYLAFKYLDKDLVNLFVGLYFAAAGILAVTITLTPPVEYCLLPWIPNRRFGWKRTVKHGLPEWLAGPSPWDLGFTCHFSFVLASLMALILIALYFTSQKAWFLNNVVAICFCLQGIRNFSVGSFQIAAVLLIGLFFYDIFWVFGTEVMVTVATNLDGPIKILLPRGSIEKDAVTGKLNLSLLGLGDIVIPGFFLALMLRFDFHLFVTQSNYKDKSADYDPFHVEHTPFPKPYFHSTLVGYILGLATTLFVMFRFNAAQPALLYLVPACLGTSFGCAMIRGEVQLLLQYSEEEEDEGEEDKPEAIKGQN